MSISRKLSRNGQMSEAFCTAMFLSVSGGLQDVYTYLYRGKVFANAQTGNIVLCSVKLVEGDWSAVLHYLVPLCFFALGVFTAELLRQKFQQMQRLHWRQLVVLCEIVMLFVVGFFPQEWNLVANALVSFACAMQVQAFRKVNVAKVSGRRVCCHDQVEGASTISPSSSCSRWAQAWAAWRWGSAAQRRSGSPACCWP